MSYIAVLRFANGRQQRIPLRIKRHSLRRLGFLPAWPSEWTAWTRNDDIPVGFGTSRMDLLRQVVEKYRKQDPDTRVVIEHDGHVVCSRGAV